MAELFEELPLYDEEKHLQTDLFEHSYFLNRAGETRWLPIRREWPISYGIPGVPTGYLDAFFLREDGLPCLVEAKIRKNDESYGSVVAQLLRYAHGFWGTTSLTGIKALAPAALSPVAFDRLQSNILARRTRLVFAIDAAPIELVIAAASLRAAGLDVDVLEVRRDRAGLPISRYVNLEKIDRYGEWSPLKTMTVVADASLFEQKKGVRRAELVMYPKSGTFRVLAAPPKTKRPRHQVDPARAEGYIGVMPNWAQYIKWGNPYPENPESDPTVMTSPKWRRWISVAKHVWDILQQQGVFSVSRDIAKLEDRMVQYSEAVLASSDWSENRRSAVVDTLLDLHLYGFADVETDGTDYFAKLATI